MFLSIVNRGYTVPFSPNNKAFEFSLNGFTEFKKIIGTTLLCGKVMFSRRLSVTLFTGE